MSQKKRFDASGAPLNAAARSWATRNPGRTVPVRFREPAPVTLSTRSPGALLERTLTWLLGQVTPPAPPASPAPATRPAEPARTHVPPSRRRRRRNQQSRSEADRPSQRQRNRPSRGEADRPAPSPAAPPPGMTPVQRLLTWALTWVRDQRLRLAQGRVDAARSRLAFEEERPALAAAQAARRQANLRRVIRWTERLDRAATRYDRMAAERRDEQAQQHGQARPLNDWADDDDDDWKRRQDEEQERRDEDDRWHESRRDDDDRGWW